MLWILQHSLLEYQKKNLEIKRSVDRNLDNPLKYNSHTKVVLNEYLLTF